MRVKKVQSLQVKRQFETGARVECLCSLDDDNERFIAAERLSEPQLGLEIADLRLHVKMLGTDAKGCGGRGAT